MNTIQEITRENFEQIANKCLNGELFGRFKTSRGVTFYVDDLHVKHLPTCNHYIFRGKYIDNDRVDSWEYTQEGYSTRDNPIEIEAGDIIKFEPLDRYVFEFYSDPSKVLGCELMNKLMRLVTKFTANGKIIKSRYTGIDV